MGGHIFIVQLNHIGEHVLQAPLGQFGQDGDEAPTPVGEAVHDAFRRPRHDLPDDQAVLLHFLELDGEDSGRDAVDFVHELIVSHGCAVARQLANDDGLPPSLYDRHGGIYGAVESRCPNHNRTYVRRI